MEKGISEKKNDVDREGYRGRFVRKFVYREKLVKKKKVYGETCL